MKSGFLKSSPHFFGIITRSMYSMVMLLLLLAIFIPAPLQEQADPAITQNPVKSAWFLLWIQEIVSWSRFMIYPVMLLGCLFILLPWLPGSVHISRASWFPREQLVISVVTIILSVAILTLTIIAMFFRGSNWSLVF